MQELAQKEQSNAAVRQGNASTTGREQEGQENIGDHFNLPRPAVKQKENAEPCPSRYWGDSLIQTSLGQLLSLHKVYLRYFCMYASLSRAICISISMRQHANSYWSYETPSCTSACLQGCCSNPIKVLFQSLCRTCRAKETVAWLHHQKKKWRVAAAARAKQKKLAEKARKRGRAQDDDAAELGPKGTTWSLALWYFGFDTAMIMRHMTQKLSCPIIYLWSFTS